MSLVILDFCLKGLMGHPYEYDRAVMLAAKAAGWKKIILAAHKHVLPVIQSELNAIPCFSADLDDDLLNPWQTYLVEQQGRDAWKKFNTVEHGHSLIRDMAHVSSDFFEVDTPNLVLVPTIRHTQIPGLIQWLEQVNVHHQVFCSVILHFTAFPDFTSNTCTASDYEAAYRLLEQSSVRNRIRLFSDSQDLISEHTRYTSHPIELVPIPHGSGPTNSRVGGGSNSKSIRLTYCGDARMNKGYHLLGDLFAALLDELTSGQLVGEIQSNVRVTSEFEVQLSKRSLMKLPNLILHDDPMPSGAYAEMLNRANIVLAPYTVDYYHSQTSGVVAEAISAGKPIIVPRGTWGWREIERYDGGGVSFLPGDGVNLLEAVRTALAALPELTAKAQKIAAKYSAFHSYDTFFRIVSSGVGL